MSPLRVAAGLASLLAAGVVLAHLPHLLGTTWTTVAAVVGGVPRGALVVLVGVWIAGLCSYTVVLTGSLPGLSHRRALLLNLSGSAVSSALPLGGALGVWMNAAMFRVWGLTRRQTADFTVTSNVVDVAGKLVVSGALLAVACAAGDLPRSTTLALLVVAGLVGIGLLLAGALTRTAGARAATRALSRVAVRLPRRDRSGTTTAPDRADALAGRWLSALLALRTRVAHRLRTGWPSMGAGVVGYVLLQGLLFALCLQVTAPLVALPVLAAAFAVDRLTSMVPITPSGAGFAEAGAGAVLLAGGGDPAGVLAGVLLYRTLVVALEVPVGGLALVGWLAARRLRRHTPAITTPAITTPLGAQP